MAGDRASRVAHIADLIRSAKWRYGETYKQLAVEWGMAYDSVKDIGGEAHAIVRGEIADPDEVTPNVCVVLSKVLVESYERGDFGQAIAAAGTWTKLAYQHRDSAKLAKASSLTLTPAVLRSLADAMESSGGGE